MESDETHPRIIADEKKLSTGNGQEGSRLGLYRIKHSRYDNLGWSGPSLFWINASSKKVAHLDIIAYKEWGLVETVVECNTILKVLFLFGWFLTFF